jgi:hypothetical protein
MSSTPFTVVPLNSVEEIDRFLGGLNKNRDYRQLFFRGQGDSEHRLVPTLFRDFGLREGISNREIINTFKSEYTGVAKFVADADELGTSLPPGYAKLKNIPFLSDDQVFNWWTNKSNDSLELIALAQHHGVKTRFLDFTFDFYTALYFAAESAFKKTTDFKSRDAAFTFFSVWILDWHFFGGRLVNAELYKIQEYYAGISHNQYLRAQKGLFIAPVFENIPGYIVGPQKVV